MSDIIDKNNKKRILIIDDEETIRSYLQRMLEEDGYLVTQSWGGNDGLAKLSAEVFDIVMTDMVMPDRNGIQVVISVREKKWPVKIIVMIGAAKSEYMLRIAKFYKADAVIQKPLIRDEVLSVVGKVLN